MIFKIKYLSPSLNSGSIILAAQFALKLLADLQARETHDQVQGMSCPINDHRERHSNPVFRHANTCYSVLSRLR